MSYAQRHFLVGAFVERDDNSSGFLKLFSAHILYVEGKYLNGTVLFTKFAKHQICIQIEGCHPKNSTHINLDPSDMYLVRFLDFLVDPQGPQNPRKTQKCEKVF